MIDLNEVTLTCTPIPARTDIEWSRAYHWHCTLIYGNESMSFQYSKGLAHADTNRKKFKSSTIPWRVPVPEGDKRFLPGTKEVYTDQLYALNEKHHGKFNDLLYHGQEPTVKEVLHSLLLDTRAGETRFEEWCAEFGYDTDSPKVERIYNHCRAVDLDLTRVFGRAGVVELLSRQEEFDQ